jgi:chromosome segregation ATPase
VCAAVSQAASEDREQQMVGVKQQLEATHAELASQQAAAATTAAQVQLLEQQLRELRADGAAAARQVSSRGLLQLEAMCAQTRYA